MKNEEQRTLLKSIPIKNKEVTAWRIIDDQAMIVNLRENTFNVLNPVATRILELLDGKTTIEDIIRRIHQEFEVDMVKAQGDCLEFVDQLVWAGLVILPFSQIKGEGPKSSREDGSLFEDIREKAINKKIPLIAHFDLTYQCNLRCIHCYVISENLSELDTSEIKNVLKQLAEAGVLYLTLSGGEILIRRDFFEIAFYARELNFALRLLTNGTMIDEEVADQISLLHPELVAISIYSMNHKVHDKITRCNGSFEKSILALKMLKERGVNLKISSVIMKSNIEDWQSIYQFSKDLGARFQTDYRIAPKSDGDKYPLKFQIEEMYLPSLLANPVFITEDQFGLSEPHTHIFDIIPCGAGHMSCYISPYGDVYPCVQLPIKCGNLKQKSFAEIWKKSSELLRVRSLNISQLPFSKCEFFDYCRLCIGLNYVENGDMLSPSKRTCKEAKIAKRLGIKRR